MKILVYQKDIVNIKSGVPKKVLQELKTFNKLGHRSYAIAENLDSKLAQLHCAKPKKRFDGQLLDTLEDYFIDHITSKGFI